MVNRILDVRGVRKNYGAFEVLKGIDLDVEEGETFAIIGPNGAGKTTLFKVMTGEVGCNGGQVLFDGADVTRQPSFRRVRRGMGRTFQVARVFNEFSVFDNVLVAVEAQFAAAGVPSGPRHTVRPGSAAVDRTHELLDKLDLSARAGTPAQSLSHGDRKRLELAIALAGRPRILMLDEPTAGMSPSDRTAAADLIRRIRASERMTVVMTEHDMGVIFGLAHRIMVMNGGTRIACGTPDEIRRDPVVRSVYLGREAQDA
ncbi:ABC transporter ATP-binding protein [Azospirillum soli]|uniref:ABC transporter ATP-binding protein n=1 Tax=Azospirillum soli TaxID=1304799 RepID=UPI001AE6976D|nr:ABC transporter ATP-binding protein [Azospirillum soli]MBP2316607.1 branched-chain amino acid transport system ATP-binding protein [Azospirillum soli]